MLPVFLTIENDEERSLAEDLYLTYKSRMYGIAYSILRKREDAEDAVMDAVHNIVKNISLFSSAERNKTESLIVIIVRNAAINRYHSNKRRSAATFDETYENVPGGSLTPEEMFGRQEEYDELLRKIRSLDAIYADVLLMKYLYEYDNATIAKAAGIAEATVRVRLMRAKAMLSKHLKGGVRDGQ